MLARLQKEQSKHFSLISPILNSDNIYIYSNHFASNNVLFGIIFNEKKMEKEKNKKGVNGTRKLEIGQILLAFAVAKEYILQLCFYVVTDEAMHSLFHSQALTDFWVQNAS